MCVGDCPLQVPSMKLFRGEYNICRMLGSACTVNQFAFCTDMDVLQLYRLICVQLATHSIFMTVRLWSGNQYQRIRYRRQSDMNVKRRGEKVTPSTYRRMH
jgi:hypothetical protein